MDPTWIVLCGGPADGRTMDGMGCPEIVVPVVGDWHPYRMVCEDRSRGRLCEDRECLYFSHVLWLATYRWDGGDYADFVKMVPA